LKIRKNSHKNQRCFIIATGPSLGTMVKLPFIGREVNIGVNKSYLITHHAGFISPYYAISDTTMYMACMNAYNKLGVEQVLTYGKVKDDFGLEFEGDVSVEYVNYLGGKLWREEEFVYDLEEGTNTGWTVVIDIAIPWAMYMGCNPIYLIGCDSSPTGHVYSESEHTYSEDSIHHNRNVNWDNIMDSYKAVKRVADRDGFNIYNATDGGALEVFERVNLNDLF